MNQPTIIPAVAELDDYVAAYEQARSEGHPHLQEFLPPQEHSLYLPVLRELIRVELELSWREGKPRSVRTFLDDYPLLVRDRTSVQEIAFEEYRLRLLAGEQPSPAEYASQFGIDTSGWFIPAPSSQPEPIPPTRLDDSRTPAPADLAFSVSPTNQEATDGFPAAGQVVAGFKLVRELGRGSFGCVYLAEQAMLSDRPVALKISSPQFVGEAKTLARLQHTHIVPIYSLHRVGQHVAVCMPYLGSMTLADLLRKLRREPTLPHSGKWIIDAIGITQEGSFPGRERLARSTYAEAVLWIIARLAEGLDHAHERGIVHRDLKPANVLLADDATPMLLDFNLA
jgi:hypothetical protein